METLNNSMENTYEAQIGKLIHTAGTLQLTDTEKAALFDAKIDPEELLIKEDGTVYAPWTFYVGRLNKALGGGHQWALVPQGNPMTKDGLTIWGFHLIIRGTYCGFSFGEASGCDIGGWGKQIEAAKSNALMRLCKELGIGLELWDKNFIKEWMDQYAHQDNRGKWKKGKAAKVEKPNPDKIRQDWSQLKTEEELKEAWTKLDELQQQDPEVFKLMKEQVARVRKPAPIEKIYSVAIEDQQQAVKDFTQALRQYPTSAEVLVNTKLEISRLIKKGFMEENIGSLHEVSEAIIKEKKEAAAKQQQKKEQDRAAKKQAA